jgi:hypothetical protein
LLSDPLSLKSLSIAAATAITVVETNSFVTIDAGAGKSIRKAAAFSFTTGFPNVVPAQLTLAHSTSSENKPLITNRHMGRLDFSFKNREGDPLQAFIFFVAGIPAGGIYGDDGTTNVPESTIGYALASNLVGLMAVNPSSAALSATRINSLMAGEP